MTKPKKKVRRENTMNSCWNCHDPIDGQTAERNGNLCDGCKAAQPHASDPAVPANELRDLLQDCMSPHAVAWIAKRMGVQLWIGNPRHDQTRQEIKWFAQCLEEAVGGKDAVERLCKEIDI